MKAEPVCFRCLERLATQAVELATPNQALRRLALGRALEVLRAEFSTDQVPTVISSRMHAEIKRVTGNLDPYQGWKERELRAARELSSKLEPKLGKDLRSVVRFAGAGNLVDFFKPLEHELLAPPELEVDEVEELEQALSQAREVLYLADNAGECFFDLPLFKRLQERAEVVYVVKGGPIQNDLTLTDLERSGLMKEFGRVLSTGAAEIGVNLASCSREFREAFERADLVIAKGMGNYESLSELGLGRRVFFILVAKCEPVARSLGVKLDSLVARFG